MRIAFFTHYTLMYGANRSMLNLIEGLRDFDVTSHVVAPSEGAITEVLCERNIPTMISPSEKWVSHQNFDCGFATGLYRRSRNSYHALKRLSKNFGLLPKLAQQLKDWNIDLIYTNSGVIPIGAFAARWSGIPHVWHLREFIDLDYNYHHDWLKPFFNHWLYRADAQIAISRSIQSHFFHDRPPQSAHVIYNGVASKATFDHRYKQYRRAAKASTVYTFAIVGIVHPAKGQDVAIRALAKVTQSTNCSVRLLIVGGGDSAEIQTLAHQLGVADKVEFWGHIDDTYQAYREADAVLMCSAHEGMGRVTVEAMSACCPVIGFNSAGTAEIIKHEQTGLLYEHGYEQLAFYMQKVIENPDWAQQLGENGWRTARQKYCVESYAHQIYQVLNSVLGQAASPVPAKLLVGLR